MPDTRTPATSIGSNRIRHIPRHDVGSGAAATSAPYFTITARETRLGPENVACTEFATTCALRCRGAIDPPLLARLDGICDAAEFRSQHVEALGHRRIEAPALAGPVISLLLRRAPLFRWLERVTGCATIVDVEGRVVETWPYPGDELAWHDDIEPPRLLAVTIALTCSPYEGGAFQLRRVGTHDALVDFQHDTPGTALIFTVSRRYEHRLCPLVSGGPRRVFTGWFLGA